MEGERIVLTSLEADVNGGTLEGSGSVVIDEGTIQDARLKFALDDFAFDAPMQLRSISDSDIEITGNRDEITIAGQVTLEEGGLTGDINFDTGLLAAMTARRELDLTEERDPLLERIRFAIDVNTAASLLVDNNLAKAEVEADLRVLGTPYETGLSGRVTLLEGAQVTLNEREYEVERGVITFLEDRRIAPSFDLVLRTSASRYDITITISGTPGETETAFTSDPILPEPDIMALLVTGRTLDEMRGEEFEVAREQVLSYLAGRVGSTLGRGIEEATGLSEVRIEPTLIANEANPGARFTVGQELTDQLSLIYSTNLADVDDEIWIAEYDITRRFQGRAIRQEDGSYRAEFRHDLRFGGQPAPTRLPRVRSTVTGIVVTADPELDEEELRDLLGISAGEPYDFFAGREGVERIEKYLRDQDFLQSRVRLQRNEHDKGVELHLEVGKGPVVHLEFDGVRPSRGVREEARIQWQRGVFDAQRAGDVVETLRGWLMEEDYLQPQIEHTISDISADERRVVLHVEPGVRFSTVRLVFEGASAVEPEVLDDIVEEQELERQLFIDPIVVTELLERYYREQGYLAIEIDEPRYEYEGRIARVVLVVREGPRFAIRTVSAEGTKAIPADTLLRGLPLISGDPFLPATAERSLERIRDVYWQRGYNDVRSDYELVIDRPSAAVDVTFLVEEGLQSVVSDIVVTGNERTSDDLVYQQIVVEPSEPLDLSMLARSRRNLYDTGVYSIVDIIRSDTADDELEAGGETQPPAAAAPSAPIEAPAADGQKPVHLEVNVREVQPFRFEYGASYDTERGIGGIADISNVGSLGRARVVGFRSRYDAELTEFRAYASQPSLRSWPVRTLGSVYYQQERNPASALQSAFDVTRRGASIQQEAELANSYVFSYGYRFERVRTFQETLIGPLDFVLTVAPLTSSLVREARDEILDATRGSFMSHSLSYAPGMLGADQPFLSYFGQYFHYVPLQAPQRKRFTNEIIRPRFVYAVGARLGLAVALGDGQVPISEQFLAGGSQSMRGFEQDSIRAGASGVFGGNALLVINNELRFPLVSIVDGVVFADVGNVFSRVADLSIDLRKSGGVGLRVRTPWFLLRGDYGVVLDRREGETRSQFFFGIGQAF
jgi:outer membrane protein assembly factor BamA